MTSSTTWDAATEGSWWLPRKNMAFTRWAWILIPSGLPKPEPMRGNTESSIWSNFTKATPRNSTFPNATIVTLYLGADGNLRLAERLRSELRPGARIVSRNFRIDGWAPDRSEMHELTNGICHQTSFVDNSEG